MSESQKLNYQVISPGRRRPRAATKLAFWLGLLGGLGVVTNGWVVWTFARKCPTALDSRRGGDDPCAGYELKLTPPAPAYNGMSTGPEGIARAARQQILARMGQTALFTDRRAVMLDRLLSEGGESAFPGGAGASAILGAGPLPPDGASAGAMHYLQTAQAMILVGDHDSALFEFPDRHSYWGLQTMIFSRHDWKVAPSFVDRCLEYWHVSTEGQFTAWHAGAVWAQRQSISDVRVDEGGFVRGMMLHQPVYIHPDGRMLIQPPYAHDQKTGLPEAEMLLFNGMVTAREPWLERWRLGFMVHRTDCIAAIAVGTMGLFQSMLWFLAAAQLTFGWRGSRSALRVWWGVRLVATALPLVVAPLIAEPVMDMFDLASELADGLFLARAACLWVLVSWWVSRRIRRMTRSPEVMNYIQEVEDARSVAADGWLRVRLGHLRYSSVGRRVLRMWRVMAIALALMLAAAHAVAAFAPAWERWWPIGAHIGGAAAMLCCAVYWWRARPGPVGQVRAVLRAVATACSVFLLLGAGPATAPAGSSARSAQELVKTSQDVTLALPQRKKAIFDLAMQHPEVFRNLLANDRRLSNAALVPDTSDKPTREGVWMMAQLCEEPSLNRWTLPLMYWMGMRGDPQVYAWLKAHPSVRARKSAFDRLPGNLRNQKAADGILDAALTDSDVSVREAAARYFGRGAIEGFAYLVAACVKAKNPQDTAAAQAALGAASVEYATQMGLVYSGHRDPLEEAMGTQKTQGQAVQWTTWARPANPRPRGLLPSSVMDWVGVATWGMLGATTLAGMLRREE